MSNLEYVRRCCNCGAILQCKDEKAEGYIPEHLLERDLSSLLFCTSCYQGAKYNLMPAYPSLDPDYLIMMQDAQARDALIVYVVDLFSFECSFIPEITQAIEGLPIIVIANKRDLLPSSVSDDELREYVAHRFRRAELRVKAEDVVLTSFTSLSNTNELYSLIQEKRQGHDVYIIGAKLAGKTLFLNAFLRNYTNNSRRSIQTADYPGTTLKVLEIPLDNSASLYDTPGTNIDNALFTRLDQTSSALVVPTERVKGRSLHLSKKEKLLIGGVARLELIEGEKTQLKCYFAKKVTLNRHHGALDESHSFALMKRRLNVPQLETLRSSADLDVYEIQVNETGNRDIGIEGLGWISFKGDAQRFRIFIPKGVAVYTSRAKLPLEVK